MFKKHCVITVDWGNKNPYEAASATLAGWLSGGKLLKDHCKQSIMQKRVQLITEGAVLTSFMIINGLCHAVGSSHLSEIFTS